MGRRSAGARTSPGLSRGSAPRVEVSGGPPPARRAAVPDGRPPRPESHRAGDHPAPPRPERPRPERPWESRPAAFRPEGPRPERSWEPRPSRPARPWDRGPAYPRPDARPVRAVTGELPQLAEDEELVAGRRPVEEAFVARREARRLLVVPQRRLALEKLVLHATSLRIPVVEVEGGSLTAIAGFDGHQGVALVVAPRQWAGLDDILALAAQRGEAPLVLVLDSLEDPQNVGTLLRTAEASGVHGAIFPTRRQAPLTPAAVKASAGAVEHLRLAPVDDLPGALADLHVRGLRIVGADGDAPLTAREADLRGPIAIVVGSEGRGLGPAVRRRCDLVVRIPMHGRIESLNASVAGSILLYEAAAQRGTPETPPASAATVDDEPAAPAAADKPAPPAPSADPAAQLAPEAADRPLEELTAQPLVVPAAKPRKRRAAAAPAPDSPAAPSGAGPGDDLLPGGPPVAGTGAPDAVAAASDAMPDVPGEPPAASGEV